MLEPELVRLLRTLAVEEAHLNPEVRPSIRPLAQRRVLVVDDDLMVQRVVSQALIHGGAEVETCSDGSAALERVASTKPDLVILDLIMPVMGGREVLEALRQSPQTADLPVVIHTGCAEAEFLDWARALHAAAVLSKPTRPGEVVALAKRVLDGARPLELAPVR